MMSMNHHAHCLRLTGAMLCYAGLFIGSAQAANTDYLIPEEDKVALLDEEFYTGGPGRFGAPTDSTGRWAFSGFINNAGTQVIFTGLNLTPPLITGLFVVNIGDPGSWRLVALPTGEVWSVDDQYVAGGNKRIHVASGVVEDLAYSFNVPLGLDLMNDACVSPQLSFEFNTDGNPQGWGVNANNVTGITATGGNLVGTITGPNPFFSVSNLVLDPSIARFMVLRMRVSSNNNTSVAVFWEHLIDPINSNKGWGSVLGPSGEWRTYILDLSTNPNWNIGNLPVNLDLVNDACVSPQLAFEFNTDGNPEGWGLSPNRNSVSGITATGGNLVGTITGPNPYLSVQGLRVDPSVARYAVIRMRRMLADGTFNGAVFWGHVNDPISGDKRILFPLGPSGEWRTYIIDLAANPLWNIGNLPLNLDLANDACVNPQLAFEFNTDGDPEGWGLSPNRNSVSGIAAIGGGLIGNIIGPDPYFSVQGLSLDPASAHFVVIRMRVTSNAVQDTAEVFWGHVTDPINQNKRITVPLGPTGEWRTYIVDVNANPNWNIGQNIEHLRIDPSSRGSSGSFEIDFVRLCSDTNLYDYRNQPIADDGSPDGPKVELFRIDHTFNNQSTGSFEIDFVRLCSNTGLYQYRNQPIDDSGSPDGLKIKRLRFHPSQGASSGTFEIDFIRLCSETNLDYLRVPIRDDGSIDLSVGLSSTTVNLPDEIAVGAYTSDLVTKSRDVIAFGVNDDLSLDTSRLPFTPLTAFGGSVRVGGVGGGVQISNDGTLLVFTDFVPSSQPNLSLPGHESHIADIYVLEGVQDILNGLTPPPTSLSDARIHAIRTQSEGGHRFKGVPRFSPDKSLVIYVEDVNDKFSGSAESITAAHGEIMISTPLGNDGPPVDGANTSDDRRFPNAAGRWISDVTRSGMRLILNEKSSTADPLRLFITTFVQKTNITTEVVDLPAGGTEATIGGDVQTLPFVLTDSAVQVTMPTIVKDTSGTSLALPMDQVINFPSGTTTPELTIFTPISPAEQPQLPPGVNAIPVLRTFGPPGTQFAPPIEITISYLDTEIVGLDESSLKLYLYNETTGVFDIPIPESDIVSRDPVANTVTYKIGHFSIHGLGFASPPPPSPPVTPVDMPANSRFGLFVLVFLLTGLGTIAIKRRRSYGA